MDKSYYQIKCEEIAEGSPLQVMSYGKTNGNYPIHCFCCQQHYHNLSNLFHVQLINQEHSMIKHETISLLFCFQVFYGVEFANISESEKEEGLKMNWYEVNCAKYPVSIRLIY